MNTIIALPDGKISVTYKDANHVITRIEYNSETFDITEFECLPPNDEVKAFLRSHLAKNQGLVLPGFLEEARKVKK